MLRTFSLAIFCAALSFGPAFAEETATLNDGRKVLLKDDGTYEFVGEAKKEGASGDFSEIKMADLKVDIKEMSGKKVRVRGKGSYFGEMLMLGDPEQPFDTSPIFVKIDALPRDARKWIVSNCGQGCRLVVEGDIVEDLVLFNPGIRATNVSHQ